MAFIFGGNTGTTYEQMLRQRSLADAYAQGIGTPRTFGEGLSALGKGLAAGIMNRSANKTEAAGKKAAEEKRQGALAQLFGQRFGGGPVSAQGLAPMDAGGIPDVSVPQVHVGPHSSDPRQDVSAAFAGSAAASGQNFPMSLVQSESGGNWSALNSEGYGGRLQFGKDRLADAARAGVIPAGMTGAQFSQLPPEAQQAVEQWHFADIDRQAERMGLNSYIGQSVAGIPITQDGIRAMAHLGGIGGAAKFLQSGGQYNPADSNGTSLADYAARHGAGQAGSFSGGGGYSDPMAGIDMGVVMEALADPFLDEGSKSVLGMMLQDRINQRNAIQQQQMAAQDPMRRLAREKAQLEVDAMRNPQPKLTEINGQLVNQQTGEVIGDYRTQESPGAPTTKNVTLADGSQVMVQWNPQTQVWDAAPIPQGGTAGTGAPVKLTESQAKTTLFSRMQEETAPVLNQIEQGWNPANVADAAARSLPIAGNFFQSEEGQIYRSAAEAWAEGALRISTGAAATQPEIDRNMRVYFAQPGDTPNVVAFKQRMRDMYNRAIQASLGENPGAPSLELPDAFAKKFMASEGAPPEMQQQSAQVTPPVGTPVPGPAQQEAARINSKSDYDALPRGARFIAPDGSVRIKP